ncbi:MAG: hypothetical protein OYG31_01120 [Candidatus Kaiserbacteria bacterium]|nr:hypothetical protein [Candidatus Kaiserbacteria bacterium]
MQAQKIKSILFFVIIGAGMFYFANVLVRVPEMVVDEGGEDRSQVFLSLVDRLAVIEFDIGFIDSFSQNLFISRYPDIQRTSPNVGRSNPFAEYDQSSSFDFPGVISDASGGSGFVEEDAVLGQEEFIFEEDFEEEIFFEEGTEDILLEEEEVFFEEDVEQDGVFSEGIEDGGVLQFDN